MLVADPESYLLQTFRSRPDLFAEEVLGVTLYDYQRQALLALTGPKRRVAVRSCNSVGKDFIAAIAALWWPIVWEDAAVPTTGPTWHQLEDILWGREVHRLYEGARLPLGGRLLGTSWEISPRRRAMALSTVTKEALQGIHAEHVLFIVDEASAREITDDIWQAINSVLASGDSRLLALGNPTRVEGEFYRAFHDDSEQWEPLHVSAEDTPNLQACRALGPHQVPAGCQVVQPGLITHEWVEDMMARYGPDSDFVRVHILGEFPRSGSDSVIPLEWVDLAIQREGTAAGRTGLIAAGCDIARKGTDQNALAVVSDADLIALEQWSEPSLMVTTGIILRAVQAHGIRALAIDDTGLGGGVTDRLEEIASSGEYTGPPFKLYPVNFSAKAQGEKDFHNKPSEMWWRLREIFNPEAPEPISLRGSAPMLRDLRSQLSRARYRFDTTGMGRIWVDKHGKIGERKASEDPDPPSPDLADALALAYEAWSRYYAGRPERRALRPSFLTA